MKEDARRQRNLDRLHELHPRFAARVRRVLDELESEGWRPLIQQAYRPAAEQQAAYASGHTRQRVGFHNIVGRNGRPEALAVDLVDDDAPHMPGRPFLLRLAAAADAAGLDTGIRWGLPAPLARAVDSAIALREWNAPVKVGWDPTHVQPRDLTLQQALAGARPGRA